MTMEEKKIPKTLQELYERTMNRQKLELRKEAGTQSKTKHVGERLREETIRQVTQVRLGQVTLN